MNIYLICTGNTCRSPMAEAILRSKELGNLTVRSAGINAQDGQLISRHAKTLIEEADMPYTPWSRAVTGEDLESADVVLTMTEGHKAELLYRYPTMREKTFTLKSFVEFEPGGDVQDPYGGSLDIYRQTFSELSAVMDRLEQKLTEGKV
ncbi:low molecular weight protein arginine phosphatase [Sporosarcina sp. FSL K6-2383]|uniref:low molecular weight protein arginine phosphatase n=1 Tax=Sporosarcina sp. FSL K6-2383 TaxID=2921556 RepID=UPI00315A7996